MGVRLRLSAAGAWTSAEASRIAREIARIAWPSGAAEGLTAVIDIAGIEDLDTAGAWLLQRTWMMLEERGCATQLSGAAPEHRILLDEVGQRAGLALKPPLQFVSRWRRIAGLLVTIRRGLLDLASLTQFLGAFTLTLLATLARPRRFRLTSFVHHLDHVGLRAVFIVSLICSLIGAVIMQQGVVQLRPFGAELFAVNMLGLLSLREVGVLLTAIMVAGRSGSAYTAEIGSMKMREEIDAMRAIGIDPMETLVLPRVLALLVALPILTFIGDLMCLAGGGLMAMLVLDLDAAVLIERMHRIVTLRHFLAGLIKAPFMAVIIGLVGCLEGLKVKGGAESLGERVTRSVVKAIFLVIIADAAVAMFLSAIGI